MDSVHDIYDVFYSKGYKLYRDESYKSDKTEERKKKWQYNELRGKYGMVYPYSSIQLAAQAFRNVGKIPTQFVKSKGYRVIQDADDVLVFLFPAKDFDEIAKRLQLKKKRIISEAHKNAVKEAQKRRWNSEKSNLNGGF